MNRSQVAKRIAWMWENAEVDDTARNFVDLYMADLEECGQTRYLSGVDKISSVGRQLDNYFFKIDRSPVLCKGGEMIHLERTPGKKEECFKISYPQELETDLETD